MGYVRYRFLVLVDFTFFIVLCIANYFCLPPYNGSFSFSSIAYVYVGLYGYNYLDAGKNVITLFQNKGWTTIITDDLVENVLFMMNVGLGLITGLVGLFMVKLDQNLFANLGVEDTSSIGFL